MRAREAQLGGVDGTGVAFLQACAAAEGTAHPCTCRSACMPWLLPHCKARVPQTGSSSLLAHQGCLPLPVHVQTAAEKLDVPDNSQDIV